MKLKKTILKNDVPFLAAPTDGSGSVTVLFFFTVGSRYEPDRLRGISHFLEHVFFKGTKKRPTARDLSMEIDGLGGEVNAFTGKEYTGYYIKAPAKHLPKLFDILTDMLVNATFRAAEVKRESGAIVEEMNMYRDNPIMRIEDLTEETVFGNNTLGKLIIGNEKTVRGTTRKDIVAYRDEHYHSGNLIISVAGSFKHAEALRLAKRAVSKFPKKPATEHREEKITQIAPRFSFEPKDSEQLMVSLSFPAYGHNHPDHDALRVLADVLGGGMSSRLFIEVRERRGLAYSVHADATAYQGSGLFTVTAGIDRHKLDVALSAILKELRKMRRATVGAAELRKSKEHLKGNTVLALENSRQLATWVASQEAFDGGAKTITSRLKDIEKITASDLRRVAKDIFAKDKANLVVIGPVTNKKKLEKMIQDYTF